MRLRACECCEFCHLPQASQAATFHIDHVWPRSRGGLTTADNLALVCIACSLRKAAKTDGVDSRTGRKAKLYNPRLDRWSDHFSCTKSLQIRGKTPTGRVTVDALQMNDVLMLSARVLLAQLDLFPPKLP